MTPKDEITKPSLLPVLFDAARKFPPATHTFYSRSFLVNIWVDRKETLYQFYFHLCPCPETSVSTIVKFLSHQVIFGVTYSVVGLHASHCSLTTWMLSNEIAFRRHELIGGNLPTNLNLLSRWYLKWSVLCFAMSVFISEFFEFNHALPIPFHYWFLATSLNNSECESVKWT